VWIKKNTGKIDGIELIDKLRHNQIQALEFWGWSKVS
jgi:hypothetical protein